jgi:hypothetical protein
VPGLGLSGRFFAPLGANVPVICLGSRYGLDARGSIAALGNVAEDVQGVFVALHRTAVGATASHHCPRDGDQDDDGQPDENERDHNRFSLFVDSRRARATT